MLPRDWVFPSSVRGWLSEEEGQALALAATNCRVLEVGSFAGRSTICLAQTAQILVSVDHHHGDSGTGPADTASEFLHNLERFGLRDRVAIWIGDVLSFVKIAAIQPGYDMVFLDADHQEEAVDTHLLLLLPLLRVGGTLALHDWDYPAVRRAAARYGLQTGRLVGRLNLIEDFR